MSVGPPFGRGEIAASALRGRAPGAGWGVVGRGLFSVPSLFVSVALPVSFREAHGVRG